MRGLVRRIVMPAVVATLVLGGAIGVASPASADDVLPGLPNPKCFSRTPVKDFYVVPPFYEERPYTESQCGFWFGTGQIGLTGAVKAQQWTRINFSMVNLNAQYIYTGWGFEGTREPPAGTKVGNEFAYRVGATFISPKGSSETWGLSAPTTVKTVAFGAIPAEVTLQIRQLRDSEGKPKPFELILHDKRVQSAQRSVYSTTIVDPATLRTDVEIRVLSIKTDGTDIGLGSTCRTASGARLDVESPEIVVDAPRRSPYAGNYLESIAFDANKQLYGLSGGTMKGKVDIPAFTGCSTASGDDVSPLLTAALSSPDNPLSVRIGATGCLVPDGSPLPAGTESPLDKNAYCAPAAVSNPLYETNPTIKTIPTRFEIPTGPVIPVTDDE